MRDGWNGTLAPTYSGPTRLPAKSLTGSSGTRTKGGSQSPVAPSVRKHCLRPSKQNHGCVPLSVQAVPLTNTAVEYCACEKMVTKAVSPEFTWKLNDVEHVTCWFAWPNGRVQRPSSVEPTLRTKVYGPCEEFESWPETTVKLLSVAPAVNLYGDAPPRFVAVPLTGIM